MGADKKIQPIQSRWGIRTRVLHLSRHLPRARGVPGVGGLGAVANRVTAYAMFAVAMIMLVSGIVASGQ